MPKQHDECSPAASAIPSLTATEAVPDSTIKTAAAEADPPKKRSTRRRKKSLIVKLDLNKIRRESVVRHLDSLANEGEGNAVYIAPELMGVLLLETEGIRADLDQLQRIDTENEVAAFMESVKQSGQKRKWPDR